MFDDQEGLTAIRAAGTSREAKDLGRAVRGYDDGIWTRHRWAVAVAGNLAKFGQNKPLGEYLRSTAPALLVEASPYEGDRAPA